MKRTALLILLIFSGMLIRGQGINQHENNFSGEVTTAFSMDYLLYLPEGYETEESVDWPLLVFLHGSGERGNNLEKVKVHGPPKLISRGEKLPFVVLSPQCMDGYDWNAEELHVLIKSVADAYNIDEKRIYVTGLSMGGSGSWDLAMAHPDYYAAIVPVCGRVDRNYAQRAAELQDMPIWVFHGAMDDVVPVSTAAIMVNELHKLGNPVKFTIYPDANHDSWTETYSNPEVYKWLLDQKRK